MTDKYILDEKGNPVPEPDLMKWAMWLESANRFVAKYQIGECTVSTIFLGLDHRDGRGAPVLWETMVFGGPFDQEMDRCSGSRKEAEDMHDRMVDKVNKASNNPTD